MQSALGQHAGAVGTQDSTGRSPQQKLTRQGQLLSALCIQELDSESGVLGVPCNQRTGHGQKRNQLGGAGVPEMPDARQHNVKPPMTAPRDSTGRRNVGKTSA